MSGTTASTRIDTRPLASLSEHPRQASLWGSLPVHELTALAEDIRRHGLHQPVQITADGVLIDGHQRIAACRQLGWTEIECVIVADDIAEELHLSANLMRRQLDPLSRARAILALAEHRRTQERRRLDPTCLSTDLSNSGRFRDRLAAELGCSGRTCARYLQALQLPRVIQDQISAGNLGLVAALKILALDEATRDTVARQIAAGGNAKKTVKAAFADEAANEAGPSNTYSWLLDVLAELDANALAGHSSMPYEELRPLLASGVITIQKLLELEDKYAG